MAPELDVLATGLRFPEGPVWLPDGSVLVVEIQAGAVTRVSGGEAVVVSETGGGPNGAALGPDGALYVCNNGGFAWRDDLAPLVVPSGYSEETYTGGRIERVDLDAGTVEVLYSECDGHALRAPNDIVFDTTGGFWFTDSGLHKERSHEMGGVYYAQADGSAIEEVIFPVHSANGIALSPAGDRLYVADSMLGAIWYWEVTGRGEVATAAGLVPGRGELLTTMPGMQPVDSMAVDSAGNVCVATVGNGGIAVVAPDGELVDHLPTGDPVTTNICFGGHDLRTAFVTLGSTGRLASLAWPRPGLALPF